MSGGLEAGADPTSVVEAPLNGQRFLSTSQGKGDKDSSTTAVKEEPEDAEAAEAVKRLAASLALNAYGGRYDMAAVTSSAGCNSGPTGLFAPGPGHGVGLPGMDSAMMGAVMGGMGQSTMPLGDPQSMLRAGFGSPPTPSGQWDKAPPSSGALPFDDEFKLEYMDLDEFLTENDLPIETVLSEQQQIEEEQERQQMQNQPQADALQSSQGQQAPAAGNGPTEQSQQPSQQQQQQRPSPHIPVQLVTPQPTPPSSSSSVVRQAPSTAASVASSSTPSSASAPMGTSSPTSTGTSSMVGGNAVQQRSPSGATSAPGGRLPSMGESGLAPSSPPPPVSRLARSTSFCSPTRLSASSSSGMHQGPQTAPVSSSGGSGGGGGPGFDPSDAKVSSSLYNPFADLDSPGDRLDNVSGGVASGLSLSPSPFGDLDLKPTPVIRKRKKQMVSEECKDDKYWERRRKNNLAAKRSRDARRAKENQIAIRASFLERENKALAQELSKARAENHLLRERLCKYEVV